MTPEQLDKLFETIKRRIACITCDINKASIAIFSNTTTTSTTTTTTTP